MEVIPNQGETGTKVVQAEIPTNYSVEPRSIKLKAQAGDAAQQIVINQGGVTPALLLVGTHPDAVVSMNHFDSINNPYELFKEFHGCPFALLPKSAYAAYEISIRTDKVVSVRLVSSVRGNYVSSSLVELESDYRGIVQIPSSSQMGDDINSIAHSIHNAGNMNDFSRYLFYIDNQPFFILTVADSSFNAYYTSLSLVRSIATHSIQLSDALTCDFGIELSNGDTVYVPAGVTGNINFNSTLSSPATALVYGSKGQEVSIL